MKKLVRITTIPVSLEKLLENQLSFMKQYYEVIAVSSNEEKLKQYGTKEGVRIFSVEMTRKITPFKDLKAVVKLYAFFRKERPDIVHTHTPKAGTVGMIAAFLAQVPVRLHTVAGLPLLEVKGPKRKLLNIVEKITYRCATKVYPNSNGLKEIILNLKFCKESKVKVIGGGSSNGINTDHHNRNNVSNNVLEELRTGLDIKDDDFVFIFVGRLVGDKGVNELVKAFDDLSQEFSKIKLLLVGPQEPDLDPLSDVTQMILKTNINILQTGFQADVRPFFCISSVLVFPSYREGFPNVVMQAGAIGLPSIVSDINGCNEIISEGINGMLIPVKDKDAVYFSMRKMLTDRNYTESLAKNARMIIETKYKQMEVWKAILDEYKTFEDNV